MCNVRRLKAKHGEACRRCVDREDDPGEPRWAFLAHSPTTNIIKSLANNCTTTATQLPSHLSSAGTDPQWCLGDTSISPRRRHGSHTLRHACTASMPDMARGQQRHRLCTRIQTVWPKSQRNCASNTPPCRAANQGSSLEANTATQYRWRHAATRGCNRHRRRWAASTVIASRQPNDGHFLPKAPQSCTARHVPQDTHTARQAAASQRLSALSLHPSLGGGGVEVATLRRLGAGPGVGPQVTTVWTQTKNRRNRGAHGPRHLLG